MIGQFVRHRAILAREAGRDGCLCILAIQPVIHVGKPLTEREEKNSHMWGDHGRYFRVIWPELQAATARLDVPGAVTVDLTDVFSGFNGDAYQDECHYTSGGNRLIAQRLAETVRSELLARRRPETRPAVER